MPGEPTSIGPPAAAILAVIGVAHDDVLNLRDIPGLDGITVGRIPPTFTDLEAHGVTRALPQLWTLVSYQGTDGWAHMGFLGVLGQTSDVTAQIGRLETPDMESLGEAVAKALAPSDSDFTPRVEMVVPPSIGDLGEVTFDVIGLGDDSVRGLRLHVFGQAAGGGFRLVSVEQTVICDPTRGADSSGSCV